ncbi:hypothetical protein POJ06DRAFT_257202 [Lipomyces tetrasporus]|uniref:C2H2-type domain-containing protein n=1 Tax=Lipomyces tetrasporus TaxID=54092 RepID=A0AAD7QQB1_9ASCO|nr:uncharacterized protein POJ06DRAFT_257202 [Lipomyces tetrasporus]KAJ8099523.1 hypothetical protein POJ06DRAFT_257202 [Lipomyces tetrasporus]
MSHLSTEFFCPECSRAAFHSRTALSKHISDNHRRLTSIDYNGQSYTLAVTEDGTKYLCPKCEGQMTSLRSLKRHMAQFCRASDHERVHSEANPAVAQANDNAPQDRDTVTLTLNLAEPRTLDDIGLVYENTWHVAICKLCHFVVDKAIVVKHLKSVHRLVVPNDNAVLLVLRMYKLRPHLAVIWNDTVENQLDESDDEGPGPALFTEPAFRPGSKALEDIPILNGYKCALCDQKLIHVCVATKEGMRTHYKRRHTGQAVEYNEVKVQAFYGRSKVFSQLRYVQVMQGPEEMVPPITSFGIPGDIHSVPDANSTINEKRDLNQFGVKFQVYPLLEKLDLSELGPLLHAPQDKSFELLKDLCLKMLQASREDTRAGFQPMLGKVMIGERDKDFFYEVQEQATLENYSTIWGKGLWIACLAITSTGTLHDGLELTQEQTGSANDLVHDLERLKATPDVVDLATQTAALGNVVALSTHILRQQFEVVNRVLPTGESVVSQYLVPRAISLLSLRPNGSFV